MRSDLAARRPLVRLSVGLGAVYVGLCSFLWTVQRSLIYFPPPRPGAAPANLETFAVPGAELAVSVRHVPGPKALLYFGGNAEDVAWSRPDLAAAFPDRSLHLLHYRGYGPSGGEPSEEAFHADALALFDRVHATHPDVAVVGRSLGSAVAVRLASQRPVSRLILVTPFDSIARIAQRQFPLFPVRWLLVDRYESWRWAPDVTAPTLLVVAEHDEIVPRANAETLLRSFRPGIATLRLVAGADHNSISSSPEFLPLLSSGP